MNAAPALPERRHQLIGALLGLYAALIALTPGWTAKVALTAPLLAVPLLWCVLGSATAWLGLFLGCALLAPPLPIAIGDSGPHPALLLAAAGLFAGVMRLRDWRFRADAPAVALLSFFAVLLVSVGLAAFYSGPSIAGASLARVGLFGVGVYLFLYLRDGPARAAPSFRWVRLLFWCAAGSALFACVDFYFQFPAPAGYGPQFIWLDTGVFRRAQGVFYEASTLGNLCAFFLEMIAVALFRPRREQPVSVAALCAGGSVLAAAMVLSYSRASFVNLGVALAVLLWLHRSQVRWRRVVLGGACFAAAAAGLLMTVFPIFAEAFWQRVSVALPYFFEAPNAVLSGRLESWRILLDFLAAHPWHALVGIGYKTLPYSDFIGRTVVADNTYLGLLVETGIAGLAAVLALNAAILIASYRAARSANPVRSFCGVWMFCFWAGQSVQMLSADLLTYWRVLPVYFVVLALSQADDR